MNVLFSGGDNWWPAIIGSKAVENREDTERREIMVGFPSNI